ncbi:ABC transporter substrate-binding protein [Lachnospiraceae bacterium NSJ-46]|uniref:ABC transporter substrate-binding protein n=2 Tax=Jingyaoa shaoxingensis TaxID=2763671 RepID=A0ABR7N8J2_9FIRM|nr:ABC transporter substrate-binding protein [Jingyaoa shaoxingensis]
MREKSMRRHHKLIMLAAGTMVLCAGSNVLAENSVNILALKGPTAMGMVSLMNQADQGEVADENYNFQIVASPDEVTPAIAQGTADIAAVPANLASVLYQKTDGSVQVLTINTLGVLYLVENGDQIQNISDLKGKTIYASGKGATPEYALNYILKENGLTPGEDVQIEWKSEHTECVAALAEHEDAIALLPQPFVTTAQSKNDSLRVALDLTEEWDNIQKENGGNSSLVTGVTVVRTEFVQEHPEIVEDFMERYQESVTFVNDHAEEAAKMIGNYDIIPEEVAKKALPECNIVYIDGAEMKEKLSGYLEVLKQENPQAVGGTLPTDEFYYDAE